MLGAKRELKSAQFWKIAQRLGGLFSPLIIKNEEKDNQQKLCKEPSKVYSFVHLEKNRYFSTICCS